MTTYRQSHLHKGDEYDFDINQDRFDSYMAHLEKNLLCKIVPTLCTVGHRRFLDFACGTGRITSTLELLAEQSYAVDVSSKMQEIAQIKCKKTTFFLQDITISPLQIEGVDLITAFRFFGNAEDELRVAALKAINAHLLPEGFLIINNHRNPNSLYSRIERWRGENDPANLIPDKLETLLNKAGFKVEYTFGIGLWYIHRRLKPLCSPALSLTKMLEVLSKLPNAYRHCPDYIVVARKIASC